jgi:hypothetical protein
MGIITHHLLVPATESNHTAVYPLPDAPEQCHELWAKFATKSQSFPPADVAIQVTFTAKRKVEITYPNPILHFRPFLAQHKITNLLNPTPRNKSAPHLLLVCLPANGSIYKLPTSLLASARYCLIKDPTHYLLPE